MKTRRLIIAAVAASSLLFAQPAMAAPSFDYGVGTYFGVCLSSKVAGTFALQYRPAGKSWVTTDSSKAWDDRYNEGGTCPTYATGGMWVPNVGGLVDLRIINLSNKKVYYSKTINVVGAPSATAKVAMPNLIGMIDGNVNWWLSTHGYKFKIWNPDSTGHNTSLSCLMSGKNVILKQTPARGTLVVNSSTFTPKVTVNCEKKW